MIGDTPDFTDDDIAVMESYWDSLGGESSPDDDPELFSVGPELLDGPPNEPRDNIGRWTTGGSSGGAVATTTSNSSSIPSNISGSISPQKKAEIEARRKQSESSFVEKSNGNDNDSKTENKTENKTEAVSPQNKEDRIESREEYYERKDRERKAKESLPESKDDPAEFTKIGQKNLSIYDEKKIKKFIDEFEATREQYSRAEHSAIDNYAFKLKDFNDSIRKDSHGKYSVRTRNLDSAIEKGTLPRAITVFRGVSDISNVGIPKGEDAIGWEWSDKAYTSTTLDYGVTEKYFTGKYKEGSKQKVQVFKINVPKGKNAAYISDQNEYEVLFGRDSKFRITGYNEVDGKDIYETEMI